MLGDFASLDVQNTYRGSDAYVIANKLFGLSSNNKYSRETEKVGKLRLVIIYAAIICGLWTVDCGLWTVDCGLWTVDCGLWTVDCGLWTVDCGL
ncbi:hypothetical protein [Piscirickettsia salmonis]|nr:hypothetical protein [Piscirickettsia salmonis]